MNNKRILVRNITRDLSRNEVIEGLKKMIIQVPTATITIPIVTPTDIDLSKHPNTSIALISVNDINKLPILVNLINNKSLGKNKLQAEYYDIKLKSTPSPTTITPTITPTTTTITSTQPTVSSSIVTKQLKSIDNEKKENLKRKEEQKDDQPKEEEQLEKEKEIKQPIKKLKKDNNNNELTTPSSSSSSSTTAPSSSTPSTPIPPPAKKPLAPIKNKKKVLVMITQQMAEHAEKKQFLKLKAAYNYLLDHELELDHLAYGIVLNGCVRMQEYEMERQVFQHALSSKKGVNDIIYTTHIKALCETDIGECESILEKMKSQSIEPNTRTYNSILRGCIRGGNRVIASKVYQMAKDSSLVDASSVEYILKVNTQHLAINECWTVLADKFEELESTISPSVFSRLALASLMAGDLKSATRALSIVDDLMSRAPQSVTRSIMSHRDKGARSEENKISASLFERIARQEINEESDRVRDYLLRLKKGELKKVILQSMETNNSIYFSPKTFNHLYSDNTSMLENKLFLNNLFNRKDDKDKDQPNNNIFNSRRNQNRLIKMEICSGHGHWIMERAKTDLDSDWISVEIRYDRIFQIWTKKVLQDIDNLYLMAGEAHHTIKSTVPSESIDELYINYPNPPVWYGAQRLIDDQFLRELNRILKPDGTLTIVTDDKDYSEQIVKTFTTNRILKKIYQPAKNYSYIADLPEEYGTSYFNKLWSNGQRIKRFCIYAIKSKSK